MKTNGYWFITPAFDMDALYKRFVPGLPASDETKQRIYAASQQNFSSPSATGCIGAELELCAPIFALASPRPKS